MSPSPFRKPFDPKLVKAPPQRASAPTVGGVLTVSELTAMVKRAIEAGVPSTVYVVGEISNFKRHGSGHIYFTLKDRAAELSCVMWRSAAAKLKFEPNDGLQVVAAGGVDVFERTGRYQLHVRRLEPRGVGALELAFRQLRERLANEGLFDDRHKRPLPAYPRRIVLVTSPTGAAIRDMLQTLQRRCVDACVYPVAVQGPGAAAEIARAVTRVNDHAEAIGGVDLMIVGRGGGSLEDLWAFNEEAVARAIHRSRIPVISAVGHEVDVTISDLAADVRAATPTAAAELAVPMLADVLVTLDRHHAGLTRASQQQLELARARVGGVVGRRTFVEPVTVVRRREQRVDYIANRLLRSCVRMLHERRARIDALEAVVGKISPHAYWSGASIRLRDLEYRLRWAAARRLAGRRGALALQERRLDRVSPRRAIAGLRDRLVYLDRRMAAGERHRLNTDTDRISALDALLNALSYKRVLNRGYSITRLKKGRRLVRRTGQLRDRTRVVTEVAEGEFESEVVNLHQLELFE